VKGDIQQKKGNLEKIRRPINSSSGSQGPPAPSPSNTIAFSLLTKDAKGEKICGRVGDSSKGSLRRKPIHTRNKRAEFAAGMGVALASILLVDHFIFGGGRLLGGKRKIKSTPTYVG